MSHEQGKLKSMEPTIRFADLFAGVGGFAAVMHALELEPAYAVEIDQDAAKIYAKNWGNSPLGDITKDAGSLEDAKNKVPAHDVLLGGFPCQPFSKSGAQRGMEDETRGTLFFNIENIFRAHKPTVVILENVRNLASARHSADMQIILNHLRRAGYVVSDRPAVVSPHRLSKDLGGRPQFRERIFITATYAPDVAESARPEPVFESKESSKETPTVDWDLVSDLPLESNVPLDYSISEIEHLAIEAWSDWVRLFRVNNDGSNPPGFPLWSDYWTNIVLDESDSMPKWKLDFITKNAALYKANQEWIDAWLTRHSIRDFTPSRRKFEWQAADTASVWDCLLHFRPSGLRAKKPNYVPALVAITQTSIIGPLRRRLTPREALRLQGFPDWFDVEGQSDSATYKQMGNAVNVGVVYQVLRRHVLRDQDLLSRSAAGQKLVSIVSGAPNNLDALLARKN